MVKQKKEQFRHVAVFPCKLRVMAEHVYTRRDPIVCGVSDPSYIGVCYCIVKNWSRFDYTQGLILKRFRKGQAQDFRDSPEAQKAS